MNVKREAIDDKLWEHLRYRGTSIKQHVLADLPDATAPLFGDRVWQSFKQHCAAEGNVVPLLISQLEPQGPDPGMFWRRGPRKPKGSDPFGDLPPIQRLAAEGRFGRLCAKWAGNLPSWRRAILAGVARRLVLHPPDSEWGRRMRRIKGGVHCQRKYRDQGWHPLARFNQAMAKRQKGSATVLEKNDSLETATFRAAAEEARERLGITVEKMRGVQPIAPMLGSVAGGIDRIVEALRWSRDGAAVAFLDKYDSLPPADFKHLSIEEVCVAAGIDPRQLFSLAVDSLIYLCLSTVKLQIFSSLPDIMRVTVKNALRDKGRHDRRLFLQMAGVLPIPAGWSSSILRWPERQPLRPKKGPAPSSPPQQGRAIPS